MTNFFESGSFVLPSELKDDVAGRLKSGRGVHSIEFLMKGESLEGTKDFGQMLLELRKKGVRITHELSIRLEFPSAISRDAVMGLLEKMPKAKNGSLKVRMQLDPAEVAE